MKKILVADDSSVDLLHLKSILSDAGMDVVTAMNGPDAVAKARTEKPELIMMDVNMPGMDGFSVVRQLAQDPVTKAIPVVFVTSKDQKADRVFAQMLGAKGFVTKPYTAEQIMALI
jgi:twitching motility two-component system response regulator PilH